MEVGSSNSGISSSIVRKPNQRMRIENPFTLKVGQVFTGFGIGCGVGIGAGKPLNLGAIPVLNQVMSATRGATDALSGVSRHVNDSLRKMGATNIQAGIGCGIGFGHGFGVGLAVKPGVLHQIQSCFIGAMTKMMMKFGIASNLPFVQADSPMSMQSGIGMINAPSNRKRAENIPKFGTKPPALTPEGLAGYQTVGTVSASENFALKGTPVDQAFSSRTEKVISNFMQNSMLKGADTELNKVDGQLQLENTILKMVLKHQQIIDQLVEENEKLRWILLEDLKISPGKLQGSSSGRNKPTYTDCFKCRRKQRKNR